jgi:hypothetical protein
MNYGRPGRLTGVLPSTAEIHSYLNLLYLIDIGKAVMTTSCSINGISRKMLGTIVSEFSFVCQVGTRVEQLYRKFSRAKADLVLRAFRRLSL